MTLVFRYPAAALVGAAIVLVAMWLAESVLPQVLVVPNEAGKGASLLVLLFGGGLIVRRGRVIEAGVLLVGGGAAWALREAHPLSLCQSDMLFRPCTTGEVAWMAIPAVGLLLAGSILLLSAHPRWRPSR